MHQIVKQTEEEEEIKMYMELPKEDVVKMLIECNKHLDRFSKLNNKNYFLLDEEIHKMD